jgi:adenylate cyclase
MMAAPVSDDPTVGAALFTDLVGFTEYTDSVGDVAAVGVLDKQTEIAGSVLEAHADARIVKELGDGLMIWFESAHDGLAGAVSLMAAIERARTEGSFPLSIRMGLHHGEAIERGDDLVGQTINIAARVSALAGPGELLVSDEVVVACGAGAGELRLSPIGPVSVKGVQEPVWLQRVATSGFEGADGSIDE